LKLKLKNNKNYFYSGKIKINREMGNSIEKNQEKVENLLAKITANPHWNKYSSEIRAQFITFRNRYYEKQGGYTSSRQDLLKIIDKLNRCNISNECDTYLYETFIKDFIELHSRLTHLEILRSNLRDRGNNSQERCIAATFPLELTN
jgi:hypothetical protein